MRRVGRLLYNYDNQFVSARLYRIPVICEAHVDLMSDKFQTLSTLPYDSYEVECSGAFEHDAYPNAGCIILLHYKYSTIKFRTQLTRAPLGGGAISSPPPLVFLRYLLNQCRYRHQTCSTLSPNISTHCVKIFNSRLS